MANWVVLTGSDGDAVHVNLDNATHIMVRGAGSRICWTVPASEQDSGTLDVRETPAEIMKRGVIDAHRT